jgi:hypothetical protein
MPRPFYPQERVTVSFEWKDGRAPDLVGTLWRRRQAVYKSVEGTTDSPSRNHSCSGKAVTITYSECVFVALIIQHEKSVCHMILSTVACPGYIAPY